MSVSLSRRGFLGVALVVSRFRLKPVSGFRLKAEATGAGEVGEGAADVPASFPAQDPEMVKEIVTVAHGNLARVKELVTARPALARASWDWGYGDWETPIDAASHVGNRPIAEFLIANGARPTVFTAVMLGQLALVKGFVDASPGIQRMRGPHGLTFVAHARAGGPAAADVLKYLESLCDADPRYADLPLSDDEQAAVAGDYAFGPGATDRLTVAKSTRGFTIQRPGGSPRNLFHQGGLAFIPAGAEAVRVRFEPASGAATALIVEDGPLRARAPRA
jgi:hypothetical protein